MSHCYQSKPIRLWADTDRTIQPEPGGERNESQSNQDKIPFYHEREGLGENVNRKRVEDPLIGSR